MTGTYEIKKRGLMCNSTEVKSLEALELAKEKALQVNTNMATMVTLELECTVPSCDRGDGAHYKTPKLVSGLALALLLKHRAENHHLTAPPASSPCTPLKDSVKLPVILSIAPRTTTDCPPSLCKRRSGSSPVRRHPSCQSPVM